MSSALIKNYARIDIAFDRGEGSYLYTKDNKRFLDFASGIAVTNLGHAHANVTAALKSQADKLWHVSNLYNIDPQSQLAEKLISNSFADQAFFCNSGAEAVEAAIKIARIYFSANGMPERYRIISVKNAFHGRTLATIAAGGQAKHLEGFEPPVDGFDQIPLNDLQAAKRAVGNNTAAFLIEPIQGEGGINVASSEFLRGLNTLAKETGTLIIYDEVQCGMGRTGKLWAHQWSDITPDIMTLAKALGNGFPIGAVLAKESVSQALVPGKHGSTFGGNPLAMTVANAVLDEILVEGFLNQVESMGALFRIRLNNLLNNQKIFSEVRGMGLMLGLQCNASNLELMAALRDFGVLTVVADNNVLRLLPPLIIGEPEIEEACAALIQACKALET